MFTTENYTEAMDAIKTAATNYRVVFNTVGVSKAETDKAEKDLKDALAKYNGYVRSDAYERIVMSENPIVAAAQAYSFSGLATKKIKRESGTDRIECVTIEKDDSEPYSLKLIERKAEELEKGSMMHNSKWLAQIYIARLYTAAAECKLQKADMSLFYKAFEVTNDMLVYTDDGTPIDVCNMAEDKKTKFTDDLSINRLIPRIQAAVDCIVFDSTGRKDGANRYQVRREDARFLMKYMFWLDDKTGKAHLRTPEKAVALMFVVLSHVVSGVAYDVIWREEKPAK